MVSAHESSVLGRIRDGVFSLDANGRFLYVNHPTKEMLVIQDDVVGRSLMDVLKGETLTCMQEQIEHSMAIQQPQHFECAWSKGEMDWAEVHIYPSLDGVTVLFRDISSRKNIDEAFRKNHEKIVLLSEAAHHILFNKEPKEILDSLFRDLSEHLGLDVYINYIYQESFHNLKLMNYSGISETIANEIEWLNLGEAVCGRAAREKKARVAEDIDSSQDPMVSLVKGMGIKAYVCHPLLSYGRLIGTLSFGTRKRTRFTEDELDLISSICAQVAPVLERSQLISNLTQKKEQAEKAALAKTEFLSMMSHELRTPMNSILGFSQILLEDSKEPLTLQQKDRAEKILKSGQHLLRMINDILEVGKVESSRKQGEWEILDISSVYKESLKTVKPLAVNKTIRIEMKDSTGDRCRIKGNAMKLTQVFSNLLSNAIKYSPEHRDVLVEFKKDGEYVKVMVTDYGIGIPYEEQDSIFLPFYRIFNRESNIEGTGIGLSIVKQFTQELGGEVGVESKLGSGSSFWFTLPLLKDVEDF
nr:ATP-binding protein [Peribacillus acanthi]